VAHCAVARHTCEPDDTVDSQMNELFWLNGERRTGIEHPQSVGDRVAEWGGRVCDSGYDLTTTHGKSLNEMSVGRRMRPYVKYTYVTG